MSNLELSIVMPCLNEQETVGACVDEAVSALEDSGISGEVLVADNGSTDGSAEIARARGARVVVVKEQGYGRALLGGFRDAQGKYVLMGDADGSYDFGELPKFVERLREGDDLVMGCRMPAGGGVIEDGAMPWKHRWIGNPVLSSLGRLFFRTKVNDFHCGLRAFVRDRIMALELNTVGMEFASELVFKAALGKLKISEVPITLRPDKRSRVGHLRSWRDGWRHLRLMLLYSPRWLFLYPGALLTIVGLVFFSRLLQGPIELGEVSFDTNTLLVSVLALLVGMQTVVFACFAKVYAVKEKLLPEDRFSKLVLNGRPFEWGLLCGLALVLAGLLYFGVAVLEWKAAGFGDLSYPDSLRLVIPGITGIALGVQVVFGGFLLAVLGLKTR